MSLVSTIVADDKRSGYFTRSDYRWCFAINLPVGAVGLVLIFVFLRKELLGPQPIHELDETTSTGRRTRFIARLKIIDYGGQILFIVGFGLLILGLTWGGVTYSWQSAAVVVSLVIGGMLVVCFVFYERLFSGDRLIASRMPWQRPMIPWSLISCRDVGLLFFMESVSGMSLFAVRLSPDLALELYTHHYRCSTFATSISRQCWSVST